MRSLILSITGLVAACSLAPDYVRPDPPISPFYPHTPPTAEDGDGKGHSADPLLSADKIGWRNFFSDPRLQSLIAIAIANNRDLRIATLNIAQAQAQYRVQRAELFPSISLTANPSYEGLPNSTIIPTPSSVSAAGSGSATGTVPSVTQTGSQGGLYRYYTANIGFTAYELDLFGRLRSLSDAAFEIFLADESQRISTQISLVAEVAAAYLTEVADQEQLRITEDTVRSQTDSTRLTKLMLDGGTTTRLSLRQAEQALDSALANQAQYRRQVAQDENALTLLLGQKIPDDLPDGSGLSGQGLVPDLPAGLPSDLLSRRPDILAAEHNLLAANADIGAARAAFFPSITLTASDGIASNQLKNLFTGGATTWLFSPQINIPIFTWGKNEGNLDSAKLQKDISIATYEKAIQTAFREVTDALAARSFYGDQLRAEQALAAAAADSYDLAQMRFRSGVDNFLAALDSQRTLYAAQQSVVTLEQAELTNRVTLFKVLGGGWTETTQAQEPGSDRARP